MCYLFPELYLQAVGTHLNRQSEALEEEEEEDEEEGLMGSFVGPRASVVKTNVWFDSGGRLA